jgi:transposase
MGHVNSIRLTAAQRRALEAMVTRRSEIAGVVRRAQVVLWTADERAASEIAELLHLSAEAVSRIRRRFLESGVEGLADRPKAGRKDHALPAATIERIVQLALSPPPAGRTRWTTHLLGKEVGMTSGGVSNVLRRNGLKPHRVRT